ncbi:MAG TPA: hypothetical protein VGM19_06155 [Armatimonadota bacterium]|jgi:hypothetical protein
MADQNDTQSHAGSDDLENLTLEPAAGRKKGGRGSLLVVVILIAVVVVVALMYTMNQKRLAAQREADQRQQMRTLETTRLGTDLLAALAQVQAGDLLAGETALDKGIKSLNSMILDAEANKDTEAVGLLQTKKAGLESAKKKLVEQREALQALVTDQLTGLAKTVSDGQAKAPAATEAPAGAEAPGSPTPVPAPAAPDTGAAAAPAPALPAPSEAPAPAPAVPAPPAG